MGGCCSSSANKQAKAAASTERLEARRASHDGAEVLNARVDADDEALAKLGLQLNDELEEGDPLTDEEETMLKERIVAKLEDPLVMELFDDTSRVRIFRGMITNNSGTEEERIAEAIETYDKVGAWLKTDGDILKKPVPKEEALTAAMRTTIGGEDLHGHLVWCECLGDIAGLVDDGLTTDECKNCRMKTMEAIRAAQIKSCEQRGPRRYKQVYIIDLSELSVSSMRHSKVRDMAKAIVTGAGAMFPETAWKLFLVNAPFIFRSAYAIISPLIHPVTKQKIKILSGPSAYLPEMKKAGIPMSSIPKKMGGERPDKPLDEAVAELIEDGFPRAAKPWVPPKAEASPVKTREALEIEAPATGDAAPATNGTNRARLAAKGVAGVAAGGLLAYGAFALATSMMVSVVV